MSKSIFFTPWTEDVNWTYVRRSEEILDLFWSSYTLSIYVLCTGGTLETSALLEVLKSCWMLFVPDKNVKDTELGLIIPMVIKVLEF